MSFQPGLEEQELLADTFRRAGSVMTPRERFAEVLVTVGFVVAVAALWLIQPPDSFDVAPAAVCVLVLVLAALVRIDTPFGFTVPTQVAFVPLLFAVPVAIVPIAVLLALAIAGLGYVVPGGMPRSRLMQSVGNAWFSIGPAAVFAIANVAPRNAGAELLLAALVGQVVVDFTVSTLNYAIARGASLTAQLRDWWVYGIDAALSPIVLGVAEDIHATPAAALALVPLLGLLAVFARERHQRLEGLLELNRAYRGTARVLVDVVEADDTYTGEHSKSVLDLTLAAAKQFGLSPEKRRNVEFAALLHDVGKIAIPKEIINKPGQLDPQEWKVLKAHTIEGQKLLDRVGGFMREVGLIVRSHHERWDGSGYPDGLSGEDIPLEARIIACCDAWNAMRTDRTYRKALSHERAVGEMVSNAGRQFDPRVVEVLLQIIEQEADGTQRSGELSTSS